MVSDRIRKILNQKSKLHQVELRRLGKVAEDAPLSDNVIILSQKRQIRGINTLLINPDLSREDFIFYFDRLAALLIERAIECMEFQPTQIWTPHGNAYMGLRPVGEVSAVVILRGGTTLETGLRRVIPDCRAGRILIQTNYRTGEPELHYCKLSSRLPSDERVLLLDPQMASGGAALMAVRVLVDHGVKEERIVFVTYMAGRNGVNRLHSVYPDIKVVVCRLVDDMEERWVEQKYLGC